jgi:CRP/FNR family transcriptional regulator
MADRPPIATAPTRDSTPPSLWPGAQPRVTEPWAGCGACTVREHAICAPLHPDELRVLQQRVSTRRLEAHATLLEEGDAVDRVYTVLRGMLRVVNYLPDGRRQITEFLVAGDLFGLEPDGTYGGTVEAVVDTELCSIGRAGLDELGERFAALRSRLLTVSCATLRRAHELQVSLGRRSPAEKIAAFLLALADRARPLGAPTPALRLPMTRGDIADHLGLTIETVSRTFTRLRQDGIIRLPASHLIELRDQAALSELAGRPHLDLRRASSGTQ